jgi:hypothetical protein
VIRTGQQYDDRGHPVNSETRQRMRDHIRASNEVMQAAGIIEETADVRARDKAFEETLQRENEMGLRRLEVGRVLLVAGVWGVCGFRRRILVSFVPRRKISSNCTVVPKLLGWASRYSLARKVSILDFAHDWCWAASSGSLSVHRMGRFNCPCRDQWA